MRNLIEALRRWLAGKKETPPPQSGATVPQDSPSRSGSFSFFVRRPRKANWQSGGKAESHWVERLNLD